MALPGKWLVASLVTPTHRPHKFTTNLTRTQKYTHRLRRSTTLVSAQESDTPQQQQQQLDLSVLRFTLGIPGLDESYLPRWIGVAFGSLIVLNHFLSSSSPTAAQLRSEALGICLAGFSAVLPYLGKFLKGANRVEKSPLPEGINQIFILSENLSAIQKEDLAWGSYVLLRNTNTMSALIAVEDVFCARGYWNTPEDVSGAQRIEWFRSWIKELGFQDLKETLYFPQSSDAQLQRILPKGACSLLVEPVFAASDSDSNIATNAKGFVLLVSGGKYAYSDRDRAWIRAIAKKFQGSYSLEKKVTQNGCMDSRTFTTQLVKSTIKAPYPWQVDDAMALVAARSKFPYAS